MTTTLITETPEERLYDEKRWWVTGKKEIQSYKKIAPIWRDRGGDASIRRLYSLLKRFNHRQDVNIIIGDENSGLRCTGVFAHTNGRVGRCDHDNGDTFYLDDPEIGLIPVPATDIRLIKGKTIYVQPEQTKR